MDTVICLGIEWRCDTDSIDLLETSFRFKIIDFGDGTGWDLIKSINNVFGF
jgi:hypothetical protein